MTEVFNASSTAMLTMFLCIVIGFALKKANVMPDHSAKALSRIETYVLVPALILNNFMEYCTIEKLSKEYTNVICCIVLLAIAMPLGLLISKLLTKKAKDGYIRYVFTYGLVFANFGYVGNAIVPSLLGEEALFHYLLFTLPLNVAAYSWGFTILTPKDAENKDSLVKRMLNPVLISCILGIILGLINIKPYLPTFVTTTVSNLAACMGPIAMLLTGYVGGSHNFKSLLTDGRVYLVTALRLIVIPAVFLTALILLGINRDTIIYAMFAFATPLGLNTIVVPAVFGKDTKTGASMALISHTLSVITIPVFYTLLNYILP